MLHRREIASIDGRKASKRKINASAERKLEEKRASLEAKLPSSRELMPRPHGRNGKPRTSP